MKIKLGFVAEKTGTGLDSPAVDRDDLDNLTMEIDGEVMTVMSGRRTLRELERELQLRFR